MPKTDYPEFQKKPITLTTKKGEVVKALAIDANYHVGITIVDFYDHNKELACLNRREYLAFKSHSGIITGKRLPNWKRAYSVLFYYMIEGIKTGHLDGVNFMHVQGIKDICGYTGGTNGEQASCAWK